MEASRAASPPRHAPLPLERGADPAFEQLYRRHAHEVYQYALALLTNPADAEDVTQTTFLNAYRAFQHGERPQRPHNWLIAIAHNVCRMRWRQSYSRPREVPLEEVREPVAPEHEEPGLETVLRALGRLSFNQRAALVMRELEGRSCQEIADVLGLSVGAVEALLFRARRRLRLQRRALGVLSTAPLPASLSSLGAGGGAVAVGGVAVGTDLILKAAAIVAAGAVTAGLGYESVKAVVPASRSAGEQQVRPVQLSPTRQAAKHARSARLAAAKPAGRRARRDRAARSQPGAVAASQAGGPGASQPGTSGGTVFSTVASASPVPLPLPLPSAPQPTVSVPPPPPPPVSLPLPTAPTLPITVTVPTLPLPPPPPPPHLP